MLQHIKPLLQDKAIYNAVFITILIAALSLLKFQSKTMISIPSSDKVYHGIAYYFLMISWLYTFSQKEKFHNVAKYLIIGCFIYGIVIEILQGVITSYRTASFLDILANFGGIVIAVLTFHFFERKILRI
ncbi:MAG: VanZ family protein [Flavobacteriaceae bacterium]|nr:VanZ family protein [Flavobacteriaceae bacterium]